MDTYDRYYELIQECQDLELIDDAYKKKVIRRGKLVKKTFCPPGQKAKGGRCVAMSGSERAKRRVTGRKSAIKRKSKAARIKKKMRKASRKRKAFGLH